MIQSGLVWAVWPSDPMTVYWLDCWFSYLLTGSVSFWSRSRPLLSWRSSTPTSSPTGCLLLSPTSWEFLHYYSLSNRIDQGPIWMYLEVGNSKCHKLVFMDISSWEEGLIPLTQSPGGNAQTKARSNAYPGLDAVRKSDMETLGSTIRGYNSKCQKLVFMDISFYGHVWLRRGPNSSSSVTRG